MQMQRCLQAGLQHSGLQHSGSQHSGFLQQAGSQHRGLQHTGLHVFGLQHAGSGAQHLGSSQQAGSQQLTLPQGMQVNKSFRPANRSQDGLQHGLQHSGSQQAGFSQQAGSGAQQFVAGSQQATSPHGSHAPQPVFSPSRRSRSSNPNAWLLRATLTRSAPKTVLPFIEQQLLYKELG
jgi:hypothetical protein